ncbi:MAG TPA: hypothetical protein VGQ59_03560 [Cyclobacteriaceae bacterium]|jgi:hypothetical protein|nr:hypothetical protein [Cyclobacteriaceae bacterium]
MQLGLLDKFNKVTVVATSVISEADRSFIAKTECEYRELLDNLTKWKTVLEKASKEIKDHGFYLLEKEFYRRSSEPSYSVDEDYSHERSPDIWNVRMMFSPAFGLKYIEETVISARSAMNRHLIEYFNSTYNLTVDFDLVDELKTTDRVIEYVIHQNDGKSLVEAGEENIIRNFQSSFRDGEILKHKIIFPHAYVRWEKYSTNANLSILIKAISFFETRVTRASDNVKTFFDNAGPGELYTFNEGKKFKAIRTYKNDKCELHFSDHAGAQEFFELFRLYENIER